MRNVEDVLLGINIGIAAGLALSGNKENTLKLYEEIMSRSILPTDNLKQNLAEYIKEHAGKDFKEQRYNDAIFQYLDVFQNTPLEPEEYRNAGVCLIELNQPEAGGTIVVVSIDDSKGSVDASRRRQDRVGGAPGLDPAFRHRKSLGQNVQLLEGIPHFQPCLLGPGAYRVLEVLLNLMLDDEDDGGKSRPPCIVEAVVQNGLAAGTDRVDLLEPAVAAAHACGHHYQNRFVAHPKNSFFGCALADGAARILFLSYTPQAPDASRPERHLPLTCKALVLSVEFWAQQCYNAVKQSGPVRADTGPEKS